MKILFLTDVLFIQFDDINADKIIKHKWRAKKNRNTYYAYASINKKQISLHHFLIGKPPKGMVTDHKNRNGLDNQIKNLHHVTVRQNNLNSSVIREDHGYGVRIDKRNRKNKWRASVKRKGKVISLGQYFTQQEAQKAVSNYSNK